MADPTSTVNISVTGNQPLIAYPTSILETGLQKYMQIQTKFNSKPFRNNPLRSNLIGSVALPIPANIQDSYTWGYQSTNLGRALGPFSPALQAAFQSIRNQNFSSFDDTLKWADSTYQSAKSSFDGAKNELAVAAISNVVGLGAATADANSAGATSFFVGAANPYLVNSFAGIGFKTWNFQFFMVPRNNKDAVACRKIINFFRYFGSPAFSGSNAILDTSYTFFISFYSVPGLYPSINTNPSPLNAYLPSIQECVLTDMNVNYNSSGLSAFHSDGSPVDYLLTLTFKETKILTQETLISDPNFTNEMPASN